VAVAVGLVVAVMRQRGSGRGTGRGRISATATSPNFSCPVSIIEVSLELGFKFTSEGWCDRSISKHSSSSNIQYSKKEIESSTFNQCDEFRAVSADLEVSSGVYANVSDGRNCGEDDVNTTAAAQSKIRRWHWLLSLLQRW
jgi:hypothetical protein